MTVLPFLHIEGTQVEIPGIYITGHPPVAPEEVYFVAYVLCVIFLILAGVLQYFLRKKLLTPLKDAEGNVKPVKNIFLKTMAVIFIVVMFFFAGVETVLQIYVFFYPYQLFLPDPQMHWKINPAVIKTYTKENLPSYITGIVDFEHQVKKQLGSYRIMCYGDSQTLGIPWVANLSLTFPKLLQSKLREQFPNKKIEVINSGVSGYSSMQGLLFFKNIGILYDPDCIIVGFGYHDGNFGIAQDKEISSGSLVMKKIRGILYQCQIYLLIRKRVLEAKRKNNQFLYRGKEVRRVSPEDYYDNLRTFAKIGEEKGIKVIFLTVPQDFPFGAINYDYTLIMRKAAKDLNIPLIDGVAMISNIPENKRRTYYVEGDIVHFNEKGNELMAEFVFQRIIKILKMF